MVGTREEEGSTVETILLSSLVGVELGDVRVEAVGGGGVFTLLVNRSSFCLAPERKLDNALCNSRLVLVYTRLFGRRVALEAMLSLYLNPLVKQNKTQSKRTCSFHTKRVEYSSNRPDENSHSSLAFNKETSTTFHPKSKSPEHSTCGAVHRSTAPATGLIARVWRRRSSTAQDLGHDLLSPNDLALFIPSACSQPQPTYRLPSACSFSVKVRKGSAFSGPIEDDCRE